MPKFSKYSIQTLEQADEKLQAICNLAIQRTDFKVICSYRNKEDQNEAYAHGFSKLKYPKSKHNHLPSSAVDLYPYPIDLKDIERFKKLSETIKQCAKELNIKIVWGGDWQFKDYGHYELA